MVQVEVIILKVISLGSFRPSNLSIVIRLIILLFFLKELVDCAFEYWLSIFYVVLDCLFKCSHFLPCTVTIIHEFLQQYISSFEKEGVIRESIQLR
jgi:hypothetical protein